MLNNYPKTRFAIVRHAKTEWNQTKRMQGQDDSPLTLEGSNQAKMWGRILSKYSWDKIISSDIGRARKTSALINLSLNVPITYDARLREQDWGDWTGMTLSQLKKTQPDALSQQLQAGWKFKPPGGEDRETVWERNHEVLIEYGEKWQGKCILVVTHQVVIKCLISRLKDDPSSLFKESQFLPNHIHWIVYDNGLRLEKMNESLS